MRYGLGGFFCFRLMFFLQPSILQGLDILDSEQVVYIQVQTKRVVGQTVILECGPTLPNVYIWGYTIPGTEHIRAVVFNFGQGPKLQSLAKTLGDLNVIANTASLLIEKLPLAAQGLYTCQALYDTPQGAKLIYYYVQLLVLVPVSKPYLLVNDSSPVEGTPMWMHCSLENGSTPINYTWEHKSSDATNATTTKVAEGNINQVNFTSISRNHTGWYRCLATNEVNQERSDSIWLEVLFGPDVPHIDVTPYSMTEKGYSALERATVSLMCQASSNPPSQYVWFYNNSQVHTGQQYNITKILRMHSGHYSCLAQNYYLNSNSKTTITLYVYYPPNGSPTCTILPTNNYTDVAFWCSWEGGYPPASLYWSSSLIGPSGVEPSFSNATLVHPGSRTPHNSTFTCHGSHVASPASYSCSTTALLPPGDPQCYANGTLNNEHVMLSCSWEGGFPQALLWWTSNNGSLLSSLVNASILVLRLRSTYGEKVFACRAKHPLSLASKMCVLKLVPPNGSPTCTILPTNNYTDVALWCSWEGGYPPASLYWTSPLISPNGTVPSLSNATLVHPGSRTLHNSTFTCHGDHVATPTSYSCNTTALLPPGDPQCYANVTLNNEYLMLSCSWGGGSPQALHWWALNNGSLLGSSKEDNIVMVLRSSSTYGENVFVCHTKHPLSPVNKLCILRLDPPRGSPICTIQPTNNYTDMALWCSWEGGYPPASLYWTSPLISPNGTEPSFTNTTLVQPGYRIPHNSTFTCHGSHVASPTSYSCNTTALLPEGDPRCYAIAPLNNEYFTLSCSWEGGSPQALLRWTFNNGSSQGSSKENTNTVVLKANSTYSGNVFACHAKHPLSPASKLCVLRLDPPNGSLTCTIQPTNNYTHVALWCSWEGGYPPASLYWTSPLISPNGTAPSLSNATLVHPGSGTPHNSTFTCHGSHVASPASYSCSTTALLPPGEPRCHAYATHLMLSCSWEGGSPQALLWWTFDNTSFLSSLKENNSILVLKASSTYSGKVFVCHAKHPLSPASKTCLLRLDPPNGSPTCTILPSNNYTDVAFWCSWEGGYPPASLYWSSPLISPSEVEPSLSNATLVHPGSGTLHNSTFTCHGSHVASSASYSCSATALLPLGEPYCHVYPTRNNEYLILSCSWEGGFPQALLWWESDDGVTQGSFKESTNILILRPSATFSGKAFVCHAKHPLAPATKLCPLRLEAPVLATQLKVVSVYEGNDVQLSCILKANYPDTEITWFNNQKKQVGEIPSKYLLYREATWSNLTVREADGVQDSGQYWCSASNAVGGAEIPITVLIKRYPVPPNVTISKIKYSSRQRTEVDLQWAVKEAGNLTGFIVERLITQEPQLKVNDTFSWVQLITGIQPDVRYHKLVGLDPTSIYAFRILAVNHRTLGYPSEVKSPEDPPFNVYPTIIGAVVSTMVLATVGFMLLFLYIVRTRNGNSRFRNILFGMQHSLSRENINSPEDEVVSRSQREGPAAVSGGSACAARGDASEPVGVTITATTAT